MISGSKLTRFLCQGIEIDLILEWRSKLTWFQWWGRKQLVFCVTDRNWHGCCVCIEIVVLVRGVETDFVVFGPIIVRGSCMDRDWLGFSSGIAIDFLFVRVGNVLFQTCRWIDLVFVWVVAIDLFFVCGPKTTWFSVSIELGFVSAWVVKIDLISMWEIELDLISM